MKIPAKSCKQTKNEQISMLKGERNALKGSTTIEKIFPIDNDNTHTALEVCQQECKLKQLPSQQLPMTEGDFIQRGKTNREREREREKVLLN